MRRVGTLLAVTFLVAGTMLTAGGVAAAGSGVLTATLTGSHQVPAVATTASGSSRVVIVGDGSTIFYQVFYSGLSGPVVAAHIHIGAVGANGPIIFPLAVGPSGMSGTLSAAQFTGANGLTYAQALDAIRSGGTYVNVHTAAHPNGEIRGQLHEADGPQHYVVTADAPEAVPAGHVWSFDDFFPRTLKVAQGSTISFAIEGFHTATLLPLGTSVAQDLAAYGVAAPDKDDTGLNPNGTTKSIELPQNILGNVLPNATCGTAADPCPFDGSQVLSIGAPAGPPGPSPLVQVTAAPGTYLFHCRVHPAMVGSLTVVATSAAATTTEDAAIAAATQISVDAAAGTAAEAAALAWTQRVNRADASVKHAWAGYETPNHYVAILEMIPAKLDVRPGDRIVWHVRGRNEPHTVTFPRDLFTDAIPTCEGPGGVDGPAAPTVMPPTGPQDFGCNGGPVDEFAFAPGNGVSVLTGPTTVSDSGAMATPQTAEAFGLGSNGALPSWSVRIDRNARQTVYHYVCQIHEGMTGEVIVAN